MTMSAAAQAQLAANAALLPAAEAILAALEAMDAAIAQAKAAVDGCSTCRTVNLVRNVDGMRLAYGLEAQATIAELTPKPAPAATASAAS